MSDFLWYVASPYSHHDLSVMTTRYITTMKACAELTGEGYFVISPIVHWHEVAKHFGLPTDCDYWEEYNKALMEACDGVIVLKLDGWEESKGVAKEIAWGEALGLEIMYV